MKPNPQQELQLQAYLAKNLRYRETYAEFYDHILSAIETLPVGISFDNASEEIIEKNFGGIAGMRLIEQNYQRAVFAEMQKKYFSYAIESLKFPGVIILALFTLTLYCLFKQPWFTFWEYLVMLLLIRFVPFLLQLAKQIKAHPVTGTPKRSVKTGFYRWLNKGPILIIGFIFEGTNSFRNADPVKATLTVVFMILFCVIITLHSVNFYRVYRDDIQASFSA